MIPRFAVVFESLQSLPATAQALLWWARLVREHGMALGAGIAGVIVAACWRCARRASARWPRSFGGCPSCAMWLLFVLARFYRTVGLLVEGGTPVLQALELSQRLLPQRLAARLEQALAELRAGRAVGETLAAHGLTTPVARRLLRVGEHSGDLGGM